MKVTVDSIERIVFIVGWHNFALVDVSVAHMDQENVETKAYADLTIGKDGHMTTASSRDPSLLRELAAALTRAAHKLASLQEEKS